MHENYRPQPKRPFGVMVRGLASSAVNAWFDPPPGQSKYYKIGICCFSAKYATLRSKRGRRGRDRMIVGFTTTYAISVYRH